MKDADHARQPGHSPGVFRCLAHTGVPDGPGRRRTSRGSVLFRCDQGGAESVTHLRIPRHQKLATKRFPEHPDEARVPCPDDCSATDEARRLLVQAGAPLRQRDVMYLSPIARYLALRQEVTSFGPAREGRPEAACASRGCVCRLGTAVQRMPDRIAGRRAFDRVATVTLPIGCHAPIILLSTMIEELRVLSATGSYSSIPAFIAVVILSAPGAALPCLARDCEQARSAVDDGAQDHCCCSCVNDDGDSAQPVEEDQSPGGGGPCGCPPGCPAPCGSGKLPCPPVEPFKAAVETAPAGVLPDPTSLPPSDATTEGVFHPPRV
jgi:hypothetical protein